ncbi:TPA: hypothetical protein RU323_004842 [Yersinia enterocolitica]|nr:hypothetical protein [Yersinia enterocolitica]HDV0806178.1 hypothetical protein [Yersinia enterocolitica]HDZ9670511.1 hypothetical protein [Yersinia enterocolitica]
MKELDSFTVERLEEIRNSFLDRIQESAPSIGEVFALIDIALAVKRAEPVGYWNDACDLDDGAFSYANDAGCTRPLYTTPQFSSPEIPKDWPTEDMVIAGFESGAWDALSSAVLKRQGWPYSCRESAECVTGIFKAMLAAAPEPQNQQQNIPEIIPQGWTSSDPANAALVMLDRIDTMDSADDDRIEDIKLIIRQLAAEPEKENG